jgi:importin subunit beta-1
MLTDIMATKVEEDAGEDKEAFGVAEAAQTCLQSVAGAARDEVVDPVMRFINTNFMSPDWKRRDAAVMAFGLIMQGPLPETLRSRYIRDVLPHLGARLKGGSACDPSISVRSSVAFALAEIFEHHVEVLTLKDELLPAVAMLCSALDDEPVVTEQVTRALDNLLESGQEQDGYTDSTGATSVLSPAFYATINLLMTRADKPDASECNVRQSCYEVISTIVHGGSKADRIVLQSLLGDSLTRIAASLSRLASATSTQAHTAEAAIQSALVGLVGDIVLAIAEDALPQADAIVASMISVLDARTSTEDAWATLTSLASFMGGADDAAGGKGGAPAIARYLPALWPRMMAALNSPADASNCKAAVVFASEVARSLGVSLLDRAAEVLTSLIKLLTDPLVERAVKPSALVCLGDVALALGPAVHPFLPTMHAVVLGAAAIPVPQVRPSPLFFSHNPLTLLTPNTPAGCRRGAGRVRERHQDGVPRRVDGHGHGVQC